MPEHKNHPEGSFCWADLATTDLGKAMEFYGGLFGWQMRVEPPNDQTSMEYAMCTLDGKFVCGMGPLSDEMKENGVPPVWSTYLCSHDLEAWAKRVVELGGEVQVPPMTIGEFGGMAFFKSPTGEVFGAWQPALHTGYQVSYQPGAVCWNELASPDADKSRAFYEGLCGWGSKVKEFEHTNYTYFSKEDIPGMAGGMLQMTKEWGETPAHWMVYFAVEDCDASAKKVEELGGKVCVPPTDIPPGRFSVVSDTTGATFTIMKLNEDYTGE